MENIKDYLKTTTEFQDLVTERAEQLFKAQGYKYEVSFRGLEFEKHQVTVEFGERTNNDCLDLDWVSLSIEQLEMNDSEWEKYIQQVTEETITKEKNEKERFEKLKLENKQREFDRLKKELGME